MSTLQDIQQAIRLLSRFEREQLAEWILNSEDFGDRVAEAIPAYGSEPDATPLSAVHRRRLTLDEYWEIEQESSVKYEYVAGEIFAMSTPTLRHNVMGFELTSLFNNHLKGGPCRAFLFEVTVQLKVDQEDVIYYPDVVVACDSQNWDQGTVTNPRLIVELLSPSTERTDRAEKALNYRHLPSLEEYVLVAQRKPEVTIYRRSDEWRAVVLSTREAIAEFRSIGLHMPLEEIYTDAR
jgi:Uma2 family endonuclease